MSSPVNVFGPGRYTEFFLHGSQAVAVKFASCLAGIQNVREAKRGEFTRRAFHNGKLSISEVRGIDRLIKSRTEKERNAAFGQMRGGVRAIEIRKQLIQILSKLFVIIDFGEHVNLELREAQQDVSEILHELNRMIKAWDGAERAQRGLDIVLYGRPNSGKSSILNQLAHDDVAIVSSIPGTTRDSLETIIQINGVRCRLTDTAGVRQKTNDVIEAEGIRRAQKRIQSADIICVVVDPQFTSDDDVESILNDVEVMRNREARVIIAKNKSDLSLKYPKLPSNFTTVSTNATTDTGCKQLQNCLGEIVDDLCPEASYLLDADLLRRCSFELESAVTCNDAAIMCSHLEVALEQIGELTEGIVTESVLDGIFSKFCIGK